MLLIIVLASLFTFLAVVFGLIIYLVSSILAESDDGVGEMGLGIDSQDFITTPVVSPNDDGLNQSNEFSQPISFTEGVDCYCTIRERLRAQNDSTTTSGFDFEAPNTNAPPAPISEGPSRNPSFSFSDLEGATPEEIKSAELNSRLLRASAQMAHDTPDSSIGSEPPPPPPPPTTGGNSRAPSAGEAQDRPGQSDNGPGIDWLGSPTAQKDKLISLLGAVSARQIIDDLDSRELQTGGSVLHWCKSRSSLDKLVQLGVPLNLANKRKESALHVAIRRHKLQVIIGLLVHGADIEQSNELQETPLIVACQVRNIFAVQLLLIFEANVEARDKLGLSARHHTAVICEHNKAQQNQQTPSAAHLILAMLNEIGAKRCQLGAPKLIPSPSLRSELQKRAGSGSSNLVGKSTTTCTRANSDTSPAWRTPIGRDKQTACPDGCASSGIYNGNSYNRWPNFKRESLYKRHMFEDIIEAHLAQARQKRGANGLKRSRLLCIDGGGLRGVIVCQILIEMEKYLKRPMVSYFDWIGGTSVGSFIACALCIGVPLHKLRQICFDVKDEVFSGGRPYNSKFLERVLKRTFGPERRLSEIKDKKLAVTTVLADREPCQLRMFRNFLSPSRLLEKHGFASDTFNNMSGHSIISEQHKTGGKRKPSSLAREQKGKSLKVSSIETQRPKDKSRPTSGPTSVMSSKQQQELTKESNSANQSSAKNSKDQRASGQKESSANNASGQGTQGKQLAGITRKTSTTTDVSTINNDPLDVDLDENDPDPIIWKVVRASSAAPFFFKPYGPYLDGGIISNNPTLDMLNEFESYQKVRKFLRNHVDGGTIHCIDGSLTSDSEASSKLNLVVSLGTGRGRVIGRESMVDFGQVASGIATVFSPIEFVRSLRAARDFFKRLMQQSCHTDDYILDRAQAWCSSLGIPYFRLNPPLATIFSIDDKRDEQLINALWQTKLYMRAMIDQLRELAEILDGPR